MSVWGDFATKSPRKTSFARAAQPGGPPPCLWEKSRVSHLLTRNTPYKWTWSFGKMMIIIFGFIFRFQSHWFWGGNTSFVAPWECKKPTQTSSPHNGWVFRIWIPHPSGQMIQFDTIWLEVFFGGGVIQVDPIWTQFFWGRWMNTSSQHIPALPLGLRICWRVFCKVFCWNSEFCNYSRHTNPKSLMVASEPANAD